MKLNPFKFALALGLSFSISFLICNVILTLGGQNFTLFMMNALFHDMDFSPLMSNSEFDALKLLSGMFILLIEGFILGYCTALIYNALIGTKSILP